ncbi:hypothetical protein ES765_10815 [Maribacter sp. ACAM166]|nr:hypothetical protein ES765_10815 [Maribacter sp. ACAM166]
MSGVLNGFSESEVMINLMVSGGIKTSDIEGEYLNFKHITPEKGTDLEALFSETITMFLVGSWNE